jgi:imidazoleglycerol phosphate synthase glutamine amidotransferase subunit HisH
MRIALVDYGAGNLRSASRALAEAGGEPVSDRTTGRRAPMIVVWGGRVARHTPARLAGLVDGCEAARRGTTDRHHLGAAAV